MHAKLESIIFTMFGPGFWGIYWKKAVGRFALIINWNVYDKLKGETNKEDPRKISPTAMNK